MSHDDEKHREPEADKGTPARDHQEGEDLHEGDEAVSDQSGETAPAGADREDG